jgi:hypothetical protein
MCSYCHHHHTIYETMVSCFNGTRSRRRFSSGRLGRPNFRKKRRILPSSDTVSQQARRGKKRSQKPEVVVQANLAVPLRGAGKASDLLKIKQSQDATHDLIREIFEFHGSRHFFASHQHNDNKNAHQTQQKPSGRPSKKTTNGGQFPAEVTYDRDQF